MALFSRKNKRKVVLDLEYNKQTVQQKIVDAVKYLAENKDESASKAFASYVRWALNMEILNISLGEELNDGAYAYHRGRVDALQELLERREVFISHMENAKSKDRTTDHKAKASYLPQRPKSTAGLSI